MLNELCHLADALERAGISPKEWHPQLKPLPNASEKKPCYRISIAKDNSVVSVDVLNIKLAATLRKWEPSNGSSFPGFNIQPLYRITGDDQKKKLKEWKDGKERIDIILLKSWCTELNNNWDAKLNIKIERCLNEIPQNLLKIILHSDKSQNNSVKILIDRVIKYKNYLSKLDSTPSDFRTVLENYLWASIEKTESVKTILSILIHEGDSKKVKPDDIEKDRGALSIFIEISDWSEYPVASMYSLELINRCLIAESQIEHSIELIDAYGNMMAGDIDKLPSVKLPIIADVKLRAMNSESACQLRYGTIDAVSFPIGQESRKRAKGALEWLGDESREGETWGRADGRELFFAYPSILPEISIKLTGCFGTIKSDDSEARFANAAQDVIQGLKGITKDLRTLNLTLFSLKKMDKARTKVIFHRSYSAERLVDAAEEWQKGCANIPPINSYNWSSVKGVPQIVDCKVPFPLDISKTINPVWKFDGVKKQLMCDVTSTLQASIGVELLLEQNFRIAESLLVIVLRNAKQLLVHLADANTRRRVLILTPMNYDSHKLLVPSILGLLLYKRGIKKEDYMSNAPFLVGRMLKLADELHALYCMEVRDKTLPPQLVGNALMTAALESPNQALSQLGRRLNPYISWAKQFRLKEKENSWKAGYIWKQFEDAGTLISESEIPARLSDAERAQLFLGYLASNPKKAEKQNETSSNE